MLRPYPGKRTPHHIGALSLAALARHLSFIYHLPLDHWITATLDSVPEISLHRASVQR
jgi:hypothetical protein